MANNTSIDTVQSLYLAYFQRPADYKGLEFWSNALNQNSATPSTIGEAFAKSPEFHELVAGKSHAQVVDLLYTNLFGRHADQTGLDFYKGMLESGKVTVDFVAADILKGARGADREVVENKVLAAELFTTALRIDQDYVSGRLFDLEKAKSFMASVGEDESLYTALGKLPDILEGTHAVPHAAKGGGAIEVPAIFLPKLNNQELAQELCLAYFKRPAAVAELQMLSDAISKTSFAAVSLQLSKSQEYAESVKGLTHQQVVDKLYTNLFGRHGDEAGVKFYADALGSGKMGIDQLVRAMIEGAQSNDLVVLDNRVVGAEIFTTALNIDQAVRTGYSLNTAPGQAYIDKITYDAQAYEAVRGLPKVLQDIEAIMNTPTEHAVLLGVVLPLGEGCLY